MKTTLLIVIALLAGLWFSSCGRNEPKHKLLTERNFVEGNPGWEFTSDTLQNIFIFLGDRNSEITFKLTWRTAVNDLNDHHIGYFKLEKMDANNKKIRTGDVRMQVNDREVCMAEGEDDLNYEMMTLFVDIAAPGGEFRNTPICQINGLGEFSQRIQ